MKSLIVPEVDGQAYLRTTADQFPTSVPSRMVVEHSDIITLGERYEIAAGGHIIFT